MKKLTTKKPVNKKLTNDLVGIGRSQAEEVAIALLRLAFPGIKIIRNDKSVLGRLEIDIHIPAPKIAIEVQGPTHFYPLFGLKRLEESKERDARKKKQLEELGFTLIEIDISNFTKENLYLELKKEMINNIIPQIKVLLTKK